MLMCRWNAMQIANDESSSLGILWEELYVVGYVDFVVLVVVQIVLH